MITFRPSFTPPRRATEAERNAPGPVAELTRVLLDPIQRTGIPAAQAAVRFGIDQAKQLDRELQTPFGYVIDPRSMLE